MYEIRQKKAKKLKIELKTLLLKTLTLWPSFVLPCTKGIFLLLFYSIIMLLLNLLFPLPFLVNLAV